ncbi:hTAFII28-like protein conserved region-domain-containing protein [Aspergillus karnatakaensis]|uniref:transcription initiation factor TFIID subunit 11 family protein n=1 Tax=Aspergillus karnatakaensis TaxID=1810916 RepID=UPI003CCDD377
MSSPPPPTPTSATNPNPLKRASISSASAGQQNLKRPRMHPLRQTSFPVDPDLRGFSATSDAGSVTGSFTGSVGGASVDGVFRKKRGRKSKAEKERERAERESEGPGGGGSVRGAGASTVGYGGAGGGGGNNEEGDEDDDFDDEGELLGREEGGRGAEDAEAERKNMALLVDAFNPLQSERYDLFKRAKLRKETLRRIVNHALSQSVPASVVTTINGFTKVFAGEMIEKARTVQKEWAEAHDQAALERLAQETETPDAHTSHVSKITDPHSAVKQEPVDADSDTNSAAGMFRVSAPGGRATGKLPPNPHRGQLLPSHLREALRRYKRDGEGGGVGFSGLSLGNLGVRGSVTWSAGSVGGRPLFR